MSPSTMSARERLQTHAARPNLFRAIDIDGVSNQDTSLASRSGLIDRIAPGVYLGREHLRHPLVQVAAWQLRRSDVVGGLLTMAVYYDLVDAFARGTWMLIPTGSTVLRSPGVVVVKAAPRLLDRKHDRKNGIVTLNIHGVPTRVTDEDRTVLDLWRSQRRISYEHALTALRRRVRQPSFRPPRFARLAERLDVWHRLEPYVAGMMA
ncbi:MAG: hypothetical protein ACI8RZ_006053 [Myxococcota bacterium]|jgi:hypothetical protein